MSKIFSLDSSVFVYEKEACFSVLGGLDKLPFLSGKG